MGTVVVQEFVTLDGVVQGCGSPDEDRDGGFDLGGWAMDHDEGGFVAANEGGIAALLLGRRTYEIWAASWPEADETDEHAGVFARTYNRVPKYVASRTLAEVGWSGSELLGPDVVGRVAEIRAATDGEIRVWGSTKLVATLAAADLVDEYRLITMPIVLGRGKRLFGDGFPVSRLSLAESRALPSGVVIAVYRPAGRR